MVKPLAVIGVGAVGEVLLSGLLRAGWKPQELFAVNRRQSRAEEIKERYGVPIVDVDHAAEHASTLLLAVKPQDIASLLDQLSGRVRKDQLVISVAAGVPTSFMEDKLGQVPVIRAMPNTPVLVDEGMSVISPGAFADEKDLRVAEEIFGPVGKVLRLPEKHQDAVTALSASGPAYFFFLVEAMIDAGILLGLSRSVAAELIVQTALGSAHMLRDTGEHPVRLREAVTSPGGTTINAIRELERHGVRAALLEAIEAARDRSLEIGRSFSVAETP